MTTVLTPLVERFIDATAPVLTELDGSPVRADAFRRDVAVEAGHIVGGVIDADMLHSDDELWAYIMTFAPLFANDLIRATPADARKAGVVDQRRFWLQRPSAMFELLVDADRRSGSAHAWGYYRNAIELAHAAQSLDVHLTRAELEAVDGFRTMLLSTIDAAGVRPTRGGSGSAAPQAAAAAEEEAPPAPTEPTTAPRPVAEVLEELDQLVGLEPVKHEVRLVTNLLQVQRLRAERGLSSVEGSRHLVFTGNPGTGKTTVARLLAEIYRSLEVIDSGQLVETDRSGLVAGYVGQTALRVKAAFDSAEGGVLLIDEAYALARGGENDFGREAIDTIVKLMEDRRDQLVLIVAGYPEEMATFIDANPGLRSRFPKTIHFPDYTDDELVAIFAVIAERNHYSVDEDASAAVRATIAACDHGKGFGNARVARNLFEQAVANHASRVVGQAEHSDEDLTVLRAADIPASV